MKKRTRKFMAELLSAAVAAVFIPGAASASVIGMIKAPGGTQLETEAAALQGSIGGVRLASAAGENLLVLQTGTYMVKAQAQPGVLALDADSLSIEASEDAAPVVTLKDSLYCVPRAAVTEDSCAAETVTAVTHLVLDMAEDGSAVLKAFAGEQELNPDENQFLLIINETEPETGEPVTELMSEIESATEAAGEAGSGAVTEETLTEGTSGATTETGEPFTEMTGESEGATEAETESATEAADEAGSGAVTEKALTEDMSGTATETGEPVPEEALTEGATEAATESEPETEEPLTEMTGESEGATEAETEAMSEAGSGAVPEEALTEGAIEAVTEKALTGDATGTDTETEPVTEMTGESEAATETEAAEEEPATETETETPEEYRTDFHFENEEVEITVTALEEARLPMDTELVAEKLAEDSEAYLEAKAAADKEAGLDPAAMSYTFYRIKLMSGGEELHPEEGMLTAQIEFKNIEAAEDDEQNIFHVKDTADGKVAEKVSTDEEGNSLSSADFEI